MGGERAWGWVPLKLLFPKADILTAESNTPGGVGSGHYNELNKGGESHSSVSHSPNSRGGGGVPGAALVQPSTSSFLPFH